MELFHVNCKKHCCVCQKCPRFLVFNQLSISCRSSGGIRTLVIFFFNTFIPFFFGGEIIFRHGLEAIIKIAIIQNLLLIVTMVIQADIIYNGYLGRYNVFIKERDLYYLVHVGKVSDAHRAKGWLSKGEEEKKAMAIVERTQESNVCSYRLFA